jgi:tRNA(adenine34) deaminase
MPQLNHHTVVQSGLLAEHSSQMLKQFFAERRAQIRSERDAQRAALIPVGQVIEHPGEPDTD